MEIRSLEYDPRGVSVGLDRPVEQVLDALSPRLEAARRETLDDERAWAAGRPLEAAKKPLDAGFHSLPERLLADADDKGDASQLARLQVAADRMAERVDRTIVLGIGGSYMGARALLEALCHPYHNELPRAERRQRPRMYFEGNNIDNDATQGLLDLLGRHHPAAHVSDRWGLVVISKSGGTLETAIAFRVFLRALWDSCGGDHHLAAQLVLPVTGTASKLFKLAEALGCAHDNLFEVPDGVGGRFSILSAVGLLPAALLGLDVRRLLEGAAEMNRRFETAPIGENPVLDYVGVCHHLEASRGMTIRVLATWGKPLEALGLWYDQLLSESLGKDAEHGATPITVVNTRDLHSRGQQHQEGRCDKLITNLIVDAPRRTPLAVGRLGEKFNQDDQNKNADKTLPQVLTAALEGTNQAYAEAGRPTADIRLRRLDEFTLGQLLQMLMLATVVEGRLIGVNPYGQPGVEAYKRHMERNLREQ